ncbi:hypothetical protein EOD42_09930 [Rhodovarius crocodyli]|uniref:Uncharacterized protein n=1 Tax=Rhodovarius crocodyli TaxID=1979269 RepID=A0A437MGE7_9PROT|nr:hypothetical protein EOD42_09930 [Rhodovarius crocodyli]
MTPKGYAIALLIILLWTALPLISVFASATVAAHYGCVLHEGDAHPCLIGGWDAGGTLYGMFVMGWLSLFTLPSGLALLLLWLVAVLAQAAQWAWRRRG